MSEQHDDDEGQQRQLGVLASIRFLQHILGKWAIFSKNSLTTVNFGKHTAIGETSIKRVMAKSAMGKDTKIMMANQKKVAKHCVRGSASCGFVL